MYSIQQFEESGQSNSIMDRRSGCVIHRASALYSNRKRILIFLVHVLLSIIIFCKYFTLYTLQRKLERILFFFDLISTLI